MTQAGCVPHPECETLVDLLRTRATDQPSANAFIFLVDGETEEVRWTYRQLDQHARRIAKRLQELGAAGRQVLLLFPPGLDFIAGFFGCLYAGAVAVPTYPPRPHRSLSRVVGIANDTAAIAALTVERHLGDLRPRINEDGTLRSLAWLATDTMPFAEVDEWQPEIITGNSLAYLQYTSGSTGAPKGVMITHRNVMATERMIADGFSHTRNAVGVGWLPLYHDMGLIGAVLQPLYLGCPCVLMSPVAFLQKPLRWLQAISKYQGTTSGGPSFAYEMCVREIAAEDRQQLNLRSWDVAYNGAESVRADVLERFCEAFEPYGFRREAFYPCYGMAEATLLVTGGDKQAAPVLQRVCNDALECHEVVVTGSRDNHARTLVGCGKAIGEEHILIVNPETLRPCLEDRVGEVWVSGDHVANGYWNCPQETEHTFQAHLADSGEGPFLRTGDLGFQHDGELFITGRLKDLIIIRGRNHYPQDIERTVEQCHPALAEGAVAAFSVDRYGEERLVIVQEVRRSFLRNLEADAVLTTIREAVAGQHELQTYAILLLRTSSIPKTTSGKIQRAACRKRYLANDLRSVAEWHQPLEVPGTKTPVVDGGDHLLESVANQRSAEQTIENWLISRIASRVNIPVERVDVQQPFARYGLDSVAAVKLADELGTYVGRSLDPTLAYQYPTIQSLARHLAQSTPADTSQNTADERPAAQNEPIAVIGIGCRLPGARNADEFWQLLRRGVDAVSDIPPERWTWSGYDRSQWQSDVDLQGGYLEDVDQFDPQFFSIAPREAISMDPQQRLLLEVSWQALEDAAVAPTSLAGSQAGVFVGISTGDYSRLQMARAAGISAYVGTGHALSIAANRLSYVLDLRGPSWAVDTACSSSLVAVHQACESLRHHECSLALAGGVNLILLPELTVAFAQAGMLANGGRCRTFSADADGYVRGEGCGVVVLKRLSDAQRDGDRISALILGSAVNQDGRSNGLTAPNGPSQQAVIRKAQQVAGVSPDDVGYLEAHGTGTPLGDPIEFNSLKQVLHNGQPEHQTCWVGSVKTNIGHLEAAAGIAGLIKSVLALRHEEIPPHLHLSQLNPNIRLDGSRLSIPKQRLAWTRGSRRRLAGINSFGFGGTNVHVVLGEAPDPPKFQLVENRSECLLTISAECEPALIALVNSFRRHLVENANLSLADVCYTANVGRAHFSHRMAFLARSTAEALEKLDAVLAGKQVAGSFIGTSPVFRPPRKALVFAGDRSLLGCIDNNVLRKEPVFCEALKACDVERFGVDERQAAARGAVTVAVEYAMAQLLGSWGIRPEVVVGCGLGEITASCVAGVFDLKSALRLATARSRLMQENSARSVHDYEKICRAIQYAEPTLRLLVGHGAVTTADYWLAQPTGPVDVEAGINALRAEGQHDLIEVGEIAAGGDESRVVATLAELYVRGLAVDWPGFYRGRRREKVSLPRYPFQRSRYWLDMTEGETEPPRGPLTQASALGSLLGSPSLLADQTLTPATANDEIGERIPPQSGEVEIRVDAGDGGRGCAGEVIRLGEGTVGYDVGDQVVAIAPANADRFVTVAAEYVALKPKSLPIEHAALVPAAFVTAAIALDHVTRLRPGDRVLVHGVRGEHEMVAVRLARQRGAEVVVTTENAASRGRELTGLTDSIDLASPRLTQEILTATGGDGIDLALSYRAVDSEDSILTCLAPHARLIVIGSQREETRMAITRACPDIWCTAMDPADVIDNEPALVQHVLGSLGDHSFPEQDPEITREVATGPAYRDAAFVQQWTQADSETRATLLVNYLREELARLLGMAASEIDDGEPLIHLGVDSLMALDLRNRLQEVAGTPISTAVFIEGTSVATLADKLAAIWTESTPASSPAIEPGDDSDWVEGEL